MPNYDLYVCTRSRRTKYPRSLNLPSLEAAHEVALRLARILVEGRSCWNGLAIASYDDFTVEAANEAGQIVLTIPGRWMWAYLVQSQANANHNRPRA
ncbi:DUF6894 family protein [Microvirga sp. G4-2]|uniref:DUF6894 family protein n=1 Tax=Microvirga sp. G4-2 TaxID=3434467 RepID=UPI004044F2A6